MAATLRRGVALFAGGSGQSITCWDLRRPPDGSCSATGLYELGTGNRTVANLQWHAPSSSLFANTIFNELNRFGSAYDDDFESWTKIPGTGTYRLVGKIDEEQDPGDGGVFSWPKRASHDPNKFRPPLWGGRYHAMLQYQFGVDIDVQHSVPPNEANDVSFAGNDGW